MDFRIQDPDPSSTKWFSSKFRAAGIRYEIGLAIKSGCIVWKFGGYPCGLWPDLMLAREEFTRSVNPGELTLADRNYKDPNYFLLANEKNAELHKQYMARHEIIHKRIRNFNILKNPFRNKLEKHPLVFHAVVNIVQLLMENEDPLPALEII